MAKNDFQYGGCNYYTLQCGMWLWNHHSEFTEWQLPATWYVALGWHAIEFARWQHPAMWQVVLGSWHCIRQVAGGSWRTCDKIRPNVCHIGILHLVSILTISPQSMSFCSSLQNFIQIGPPPAEKNDMSIFKMAKTIACFNYKILFFCIFATDKQRNRWTAPMH